MYQAPQGEIETTLARIWSELLGHERVGRHDNFFELGGHSLLAVQLISRLRQMLGIEVALNALFAAPVLADLAHKLTTATASTLPEIVRAPDEARSALSFAQQRLWFLDQLDEASQAYHIAMGLRLAGTLDRPALHRALDRLVARHETLRTTFTQVDGEPRQCIGREEDSRFVLVEHDVRDDPQAHRTIERLVAEEAQTSFDLEAGPLIRGRLIQQGDEEHTLLITQHHIVSDGWSMGVLVNELSALYGAYCRGEAEGLPALPVQYADYAAWQRRWMSGELLQQQADYWRATLAGAPALLDLPMDRARPAQQDYTGAFVDCRLDETLTNRLKDLSRRHGTTLYMTLLGSWAVLLSRLTGQEDVSIGTPTANRGRQEIEGLIGFFVNTLVLRLDLTGSPTVAELLLRVKTQALAAQQHQDIPFEQVVEVARPVRSLAHSPLFQVMFAWQNAPEGKLELPGLTLSPVGRTPYMAAKFDMTLVLQEAGEEIAGGIEYATALFDRSTVERYLGYWRTLLEAMVADETQAVHQLPWLPVAERRQVVEEWNATQREYPRDQCIHELFEAQVVRTPDAVALVYEQEQ
ncbi:condensation domain-containing protein, partial [Dokdonella soli]|uniref:condensation domain-containing protein n=2 Tax=Dokdonella soli TaxID=529810 RepID=UPI0036D3107F